MRCEKQASTGTSKGTGLLIVYQIGVVMICGNIDSSDVSLDDEAKSGLQKIEI